MRFYSVICSLFLLAACEAAPEGYALRPISFSDKSPISLNVARIDVIENYKSPLAAPNVEHQFATSPAQAVRIWANERLRAVGTSGSLEITIDDASVKEVKLPIKDGVRGFFTDDASERYDGVLSVTFRAYDGVNGLSRAEGSASITRSQSINEKATIADREHLWHEMVRDMANAYDREAELRLRQYFTPFIR